MQTLPVIAIIDVGKTNKKLFLLDEHYEIVHEQSEQFPEITDEDGFPCEDLNLLTAWLKRINSDLSSNKQYELKGINFSGYGASFVHLDKEGKPVAPLYNYLKPYPESLAGNFYATYGERDLFALATASPILGNLNSGLQLYWLKYERPHLFEKIDFSLHLPQYLSASFTGKMYSDITSVGCHTALWDFSKNDYHPWVYKEQIDKKLPAIHKGNYIVFFEREGKRTPVGVGLHDSSAALIPYLASFIEPFVLISTGTWCISFNPFNDSPLTFEELEKDCLCYMSYHGKPVKASRLFAGNEHEIETKRMAAHFQVANNYYKTVAYNPELIGPLQENSEIIPPKKDFRGGTQLSEFTSRNLDSFSSYEAAYHQLMLDIMAQQLASTSLVLYNSPVKKIFVDGGFSNNAVYMNLLSAAFAGIEVYAASIAQATSLGAALAMHQHWNGLPIRSDLIQLRYYAGTQPLSL